MRFHTGIQASRSAPPKIEINIPPNPDYPPEVHVSFGGLSIWLTEQESDALAKSLIDAAIRIRRENL